MKVAVAPLLIACTLACTPKRAAVVAGTTTVGAFGVGLPLAHDCSPDFRGECAPHRYSFHMTVGAAVGFIVGLWIQSQLDDDQDDLAQAPPPPPTLARTNRRPLLLDSTTPEARPARSLYPSDATVTTDDVPLSYDCVAERTNALERVCRYLLVGDPAAVCECPGGLCDDPITERCDELLDPARVLGFAVSDDRQLTIASARAEEDAALRCYAAGGVPGEVETRCRCDDEGLGDRCWCVADVACAPAAPAP